MSETKGHLHLLIATHEHKDHVSGYGTEREQFDSLTVDEVWAAWTEDPSDDLARSVVKYKGDLVEAVAMAANAFRAAQGANPNANDAALRMDEALSGLLDFVGDVPAGGMLGADFAKTVHEQMLYAVQRAGDNVRFLSPGGVIEPTFLPGFRFYVLGPPRDVVAMKNMGEHGSDDLYEMTGEISESLGASARFAAAAQSLSTYVTALGGKERQDFERTLPFDRRFHVEDPGKGTDERHSRNTIKRKKTGAASITTG